jgi:hypothetical protein
MANPRVDWLEQQFASLMDMFEDMMKKLEENNAKLRILS